MPEPGLVTGTFTKDERTQGWENKGQLLDGWVTTTALLCPPLSFPLAGGCSSREMDSARNEGTGRTQRCQCGLSFLSLHAGLPSSPTATGGQGSGCTWTRTATAPSLQAKGTSAPYLEHEMKW